MECSKAKCNRICCGRLPCPCETRIEPVISTALVPALPVRTSRFDSQSPLRGPMRRARSVAPFVMTQTHDGPPAARCTRSRQNASCFGPLVAALYFFGLKPLDVENSTFPPMDSLCSAKYCSQPRRDARETKRGQVYAR